MHPTLFGRELALTDQLVRLSVGLAAFSGLYYAIAVLNDKTYREEFLAELTAEMRETFLLRAEYLRRRRSVAEVDLRAFLPESSRSGRRRPPAFACPSVRQLDAVTRSPSTLAPSPTPVGI